MQVTIPHILCQWHLDKNLNKNLQSKCEGSQFDKINTDLKTIIQSVSIEECDALMNGFLKKYESAAKEFVKYMCTHYFGRKEKRALCYRKFLGHGNINTTAHVESFHNRLQKVYFNRIPNKRMDDLLDILLTVEKDDYASRARASLLGSTSKQSQPHNDGLLLPVDAIEKVMDDLWTIKSGNEEYHVQKLVSSCVQDLCFEKCSSLSCPNLCSHLYLCSCPAEVPLCKHIHKVHSFTERGNISNLAIDQHNEEDIQFCSISVEPNNDTSQRVLSENNHYKKLVGDLTKLLEIAKQRIQYLEHR
ncbi:uncharacterized protein LOC108252916 [Diaphorina citri]|jgi:hypothetical protein|uniref:Uncharacterized protein LOC108252916 n=1 Tax=Diaphorina citri TaxID=121845 RepID=A0A3Q0J251_DIACI|nr:uncharacterized protein LOC108252916 [Diaphorina citri]